MSRQRALAVAVLVCSVVVIGSMATSLDATITSSPDDAVDVDTDRLPFVGDGASEVADSYRDAEDGNGERQVQSQEGEDGSITSGAAAGPDAQQRAGSGDAQSGAAGSQGDGSGSGGGDGEQRSGTGDSGDQAGDTGGDETESSWSLLEQLLAAVLWIAALLVALAAGRLLVRHRHRLLARLRALARRYGLLTDSRAGEAPPGGVATESADSVVERAWAEMIQASGVRPAPSATPRECADSAIEAGVDREAARGLTALYERVRYAGRSPTPDEAERAQSLLAAVVPTATEGAAGLAAGPAGAIPGARDRGRTDGGDVEPGGPEGAGSDAGDRDGRNGPERPSHDTGGQP